MSTTAFAATTPRAAAGRYSATAQALHWIVAALMLAAVVLAWIMVNAASNDPQRAWLFTLHKSIGLTILALVAIRLAWRASHPPPRLPGTLAAWERRAAATSHVLLYIILFGMPISGYIMSATGPFPIHYFGLFIVPGPGPDKAVSNAAHWVHVAIGQWLVYLLVAIHILATTWHVVIRRDAVLSRMLPPREDAT